MMKLRIVISLCILTGFLPTEAQQLANRLSAAMQSLSKDPVFLHASVAMEVIDVQTGKSVFSYKNQNGLVPASTQKIITAYAAFETWGSDHHFTTSFSIRRSSNGKTTLVIDGNFDPSTGSDRWPNTRPDVILSRLNAELQKNGIKQIDTVVVNNSIPGVNIPNGWVWEDLGNYYGASAESFNWRENSIEIHLRSPNTLSGEVSVLSHTGPENLKIHSMLKSAEKGSGDNAYVFHSPNDSVAFIKGTIPRAERDFAIRASYFGPELFFDDLRKSSTAFQHAVFKLSDNKEAGAISLLQIQSPPLDSLVYWFLKKSINLYGESFLLAMGNGNAESGRDSIRNIAQQQGIDLTGMYLLDGSGLSPGNRLSAKVLAKTIFSAVKKKWWPLFYESLPVINGLHMKDGYITGYRCFAGIVKSSSGKQYAFSLMANTYNGSSATARQKLWSVLNLLK